MMNLWIVLPLVVVPLLLVALLVRRWLRARARRPDRLVGKDLDRAAANMNVERKPRETDERLRARMHMTLAGRRGGAAHLRDEVAAAIAVAPERVIVTSDYKTGEVTVRLLGKLLAGDLDIAQQVALDEAPLSVSVRVVADERGGSWREGGFTVGEAVTLPARAAKEGRGVVTIGGRIVGVTDRVMTVDSDAKEGGEAV
jgi:hypothetical protein